MELNHHIMAKKATDAILSHFKDGSWKCGKYSATNFYRTTVPADFPSPDASFVDESKGIMVSFEFKPPTETKRGILTGIGQCIAYLNKSSMSFLVAPNSIDGFLIGDFLTSLFIRHFEGRIPVGLIIYKNDDPTDLEITVNINKSVNKVKGIRNTTDNRYWAKHQDMPIPLFHLLLHYYYKAKIDHISTDAFAECWINSMISKTVLDDFEAVHVVDINNEPINGIASDKPISYLSHVLPAIISAYGDVETRRKVLADKIATSKPNDWPKGKPWDNSYTAVKKNLVTFLKHMHVIDSSNVITDTGIKLYHLGITNGPKSQIFKDYFTKELLITGHHFDLLIDFDKFVRDNPNNDISTVCNRMEKAYEDDGHIKRNPNRSINEGENTKPFLSFERILWNALGLVDKKFNVQWKRIMEVISLPDL